MAEAVEFTLDGKAVTAAPGETIWQVANRLGIEIPHLCYTPEPGYRPDGNCRACMVEIEGERVLAAACIRTPTSGIMLGSVGQRIKPVIGQVDPPSAEKLITNDIRGDKRERQE